MKNSWNKVVALMLAAALCVSCGVTGFAEDTQTDENTEIVEVVEQQTQEEPPKEEAPAPVQEPVADVSAEDESRYLRPLAEQVAELERRAIAAALKAHGGNKLATARQLHISRATLYGRLENPE